jgi:hypothetical protein
MTRSSRDLAARIWSAFPVTHQAFAKLLGLLDIEATTDVPTACVTFGARSRMRINPQFVASHCRNDAELVMLVLHELHHIVLGHTRLFRRATPLENFAFDAIINAHLCQLFDDFRGASLFRHTYRADVFPEALLRPPEGWRTPDERWAMTGRALAVHRALYSDAQTSYHEVQRLFPTLLLRNGAYGDHPGEGELIARVTLLGNHAGDHPIPADIAGEVRNVMARWPLVEERSGRDMGATAVVRQIEAAQVRRRAVRTIRDAILSAAQRGAGEAHGGWSAPTVESVLPFRSRADRRAEWRVAIGEAPLMWRASLASPARDTAERVHVYLDVSGSMNDVLPLLYAALVPLLAYVRREVHLFSTTVADVSHDALRRGVALTTSGTSIGIVTEHMLAQRVQRAVIVTDGWVGDVPGEHARVLAGRCTKVSAVVTHGGDARFVEALRGKAFLLPDLQKGERK